MISTGFQQDTSVAADRRRYVPAALITVVGALAFTALGVYGDGTVGNEPSTGEFLFIAGFIVVVSAVVFGLVVPRFADRPKSAGIGLGLAIAGLVFVLAFWSGLTPPLAAGGILLGQAAQARGRGAMATAAVALGSLALVAYAAVYIADWMATNNIAGM